jgi:CRISPR/Cas system-associated exonuclease Cas4 (RecB family)
MGNVLDYFSHSKVKSWRRCPKSFDYKYNHGLSRRVAPGALTRGVVFHEMLDAVVLGKDWNEPLNEYRKVYSGLWAEEAEQYMPPEELESLFHRYQAKWKDDGLDFQGESEITVEVEHQGLRFKGIIDKKPVDREGRLWVMDHKTHKVLPDENARFSDLQTVLYYWAVRENGTTPDGVLWDYVRTKPPAIPGVLKSGGLSKRANMDTDPETYMKAIKENGLDPADYAEILAKLEKNVFFKRVYLPKPNEQMIQNVVADFFDTAQEIVDAKKYPRNMNRDCKSCTYYQLCSAEVRGLDTEYIVKQMFVKRES